MSSDLEELKSINPKLDQLIAVWRITNKKAVEDVHAEIRADKTAFKIIELCAQPVSYTQLAKQVAGLTGVAEVKVRRRISELKDSGILVANRQGKEVLYVESGLISQ